MKLIRIAIFALSIVCVVTFIAPSATPAQTSRIKIMRRTSTSIEVRRNSGDFAEWGQLTDISSPHAVTFRWESKQTGATKAYYQVSEEDLSFGTTTEVMLKAIARRSLGELPATGSVKQFEIDFAAFAPATPPAATKTYYVRVITVDEQGRVVGTPSASVQVLYSAPNAPLVNMGGGNQKARPDVPGKH
jgi:hypothetical protein